MSLLIVFFLILSHLFSFFLTHFQFESSCLHMYHFEHLKSLFKKDKKYVHN